MVYVDTEVCEGCGLCVEACPHNALKLENGKAFPIQGLCRDEGHCIEVCPNQALVSVLEPEESRIQPIPVKAATPIKNVTPPFESAVAPTARQSASLSVWLGTALGFFVSDILPAITRRWMESHLSSSRSGETEQVFEKRRRQPAMRMGHERSGRGRGIRRRRRKGCRS